MENAKPTVEDLLTEIAQLKLELESQRTYCEFLDKRITAIDCGTHNNILELREQVRALIDTQLPKFTAANNAIYATIGIPAFWAPERLKPAPKLRDVI